MKNPMASALPAIKKAFVAITSKKPVIAIAAILTIAGVGVGSYFLFFRGGAQEGIQGKTDGVAQEGTGAVAGHNEPKPEKTEEHKKEDKKEDKKDSHKKEDPKDTHKEGQKEQTPSTTMSSTAVTTTISDEDNWKLETPIDTLNFNDPKDLDKARRKVARDITIGNRKALSELKGSTAEEKERKERAAAIEAWLEKGTRQDAIQ